MRLVLTRLDYFDTTQLLAYDEDGHYLYYLSDACNFIRISLDKVSNNVKDFVKNITTISPKPIKIFSSILEYDSDTVLDSNVLNNLFEGSLLRLTQDCDIRTIDYKFNTREIICLTNQDSFRTIYVFNLNVAEWRVVQKINFRNPERK